MLSERGIDVTQATLSRDLKSLKITKVANDFGNYMYIIPDANELQDSLLRKDPKQLSANAKIGFVSIEFSGNFAVIKTRNGYAAGLAYDIDMTHSQEVLGADTVFAIMREEVTHEQALKFFSRFIPIGEQ